jgi:hypothetical protein
MNSRLIEQWEVSNYAGEVDVHWILKCKPNRQQAMNCSAGHKSRLRFQERHYTFDGIDY